MVAITETKTLKTYVEGRGWMTVFYSGAAGKEKAEVLKLNGELFEARTAALELRAAAFDAIEAYA